MNDLTKISLFKNGHDNTPIKDILLYNFYYAIINGDYKSEIEKIRSCTDPEEVKRLKKELPSVTISGTFKKRNAESLIKHSMRICIDLDGKENPHIENWSELRDTLGTWKEVEFASLSASGRGVFIVILISYPEKHLQHYKAIENIFQKKYGIKTDPMCKDVPRLRFMTYDKDAVFNESVIPFRVIYQEPKREKKTYQTDNDDLGKAISEIISKRLDITGSYKNWYEIGCAVVNEYGEKGRNIFHNLSQNYPKYKYDECDRQFNACVKNPKLYSKATIFYFKNQVI